MLAFILPALLAATTVNAQTGESPNEIVVIGKRIADAEAELASCLARHCPPNEDIDATLKLAENQILAGKYRGARTTLIHSLTRNKGVAEQYPVPLSELYRANGRVAAHLGLDHAYESSIWEILRTLKKGVPDEDDRYFTARMEIATMIYRTRGHTRARLYYEEIASDARKAGRPDIAAFAELRSILNHHPPYMREAMLKKIANSGDPKTQAAALQAKLALARIAYERKDEAAAADILRQLAAYPVKRPILIYSPPYEMVAQERSKDSEIGIAMNNPPGSGGLVNPEGNNGGVSATSNIGMSQFGYRMGGNFDDMWIDVGFQISPDGTVKDLNIVRSQGDIFWSKPLLESIQGRRYTPAIADSPESKRLERYTYTSAYEAKTDSRMVGRSPNGRVEYIDLSDGGLTDPS